MKILVTGSGGREHALAWRAAASETVEVVFVAPGNAGTDGDGKLVNVDIDVMDFDAQIAFARKEQVDLTIMGPEAPLVAGAVDRFMDAGLRCFGPSRLAAQLEGSKQFTKAFLTRHRIPTAEWQAFDDVEEALAYAKAIAPPFVIKADGLAAGKGVVIAEDHAVAEQTIREMMAGQRVGDAGSRVVIEDFLVGEEASFLVIADGSHFLPLASSQDHKAAGDGDQGPNTGGMGAYSPAPVVTPEVHDRIVSRVIEPTIRGMADEGYPYTGCLYAGLMIDAEGNPRVIEFNCRFGDPETQPIMMRMKSDLSELCLAALNGELAGRSIDFDERAALTVVMAAGGYPKKYDKGDEITGLDSVSGGKVFHAGTRRDGERVETDGGRVLGVTAMGATVTEAQTNAYKIVKGIHYRGGWCRTDIGYRAVAREKASAGS
ncbi:MAG TPA: phosphoribosylamine--glycine ligase [Pseudomonadales bacterium]|nr:phosphoribosylamine--glycine ligase [Pseudomonadales bacterium]